MAQRRTPIDDDETRKRIRRTDEQLIHDLQAKIEELKSRAAAKSLKTAPAIRSTLKALRAIDRAASTASSEGDTALRHVLADARAPLSAYLEGQGLRIPKSRRPKGPRPRTPPE